VETPGDSENAAKQTWVVDPIQSDQPPQSRRSPFMATKPRPVIEPIPHNWEFEPRLVTDFLDHAVLEHAERPAVDFLGRTWA
jgi:hypothetical protein